MYVRWQTLSLMYQRPSNKSSDRHHHPHHRHHHHLQLHTHRKLLYLEGLDKFWFCSLLRYTLNHCIQLDFFFICVFLKRYRQNTAKIKCFTDSLPYSLYVFRDIGRPTDDFLNALQIFCILLASMAQLLYEDSCEGLGSGFNSHTGKFSVPADSVWPVRWQN